MLKELGVRRPLDDPKAIARLWIHGFLTEDDVAKLARAGLMTGAELEILRSEYERISQTALRVIDWELAIAHRLHGSLAIEDCFTESELLALAHDYGLTADDLVEVLASSCESELLELFKDAD